MKFDTDLILESFEPLEKLNKMNKQLNRDNIKNKLEGLVDVLRHSRKYQETAEDLTIKQKNFKLVTDLQNDYRDGKDLSKGDMMFCNNVWKRYK